MHDRAGPSPHPLSQPKPGHSTATPSVAGRRLRLLSPEEVEVWRAVAQTVDPRPGSNLPPAPTVARKPEAEPVEPARGPASPLQTPPPPARPSTLPLAPLDQRYRKKVARGLIGIERVLDLHGFNQAAAHDALRRFLHGAQAEGLRLVLVVTGKGRGAAGAAALDAWSERGLLRRGVPHWLRDPDLRPVVLGFEEASLGHGGAGALYVKLRQRRR